jgi:hypothetical protein
MRVRGNFNGGENVAGGTSEAGKCQGKGPKGERTQGDFFEKLVSKVEAVNPDAAAKISEIKDLPADERKSKVKDLLDSIGMDLKALFGKHNGGHENHAGFAKVV